MFEGFDFTDFWEDDDYALENYVLEPPDDALIAKVEEDLGYKLPASYIWLMKRHNGGSPVNTCFPSREPTGWAKDHCEITNIMGIGNKNFYSLCGRGSKFMIEEWGYPDTGVYFADTPTAGHEMVMLDYSTCGPWGEPQVVYIDQEANYRRVVLAPDFESFIRGLVNRSVYQPTAEEKAAELAQKIDNLKHGRFSDTLQGYFKAEKSVDIDKALRNLLIRLTKEKGYFALHNDELSMLTYDVQFYLHSMHHTVRSKDEYMKAYPAMLALGDGEISTGGYALGFVEDWWKQRIKNGVLKKPFLAKGYIFTNGYKKEIVNRLKAFELDF